MSSLNMRIRTGSLYIDYARTFIAVCHENALLNSGKHGALAAFFKISIRALLYEQSAQAILEDTYPPHSISDLSADHRVIYPTLHGLVYDFHIPQRDGR